jgi:hypothetical protein
VTRLTVIRAGAGAAVLAGACWVIKAAGILLTGDQLPGAFEVAFLLFPVALVGLYAVIGRRGGRLAMCGLVVAVTAELSAVAVGVGRLLGPDDWVPREETVTVLTPFIVLAGFGTYVALLLLGLAVRRKQALPGRWWTLPLALAVSAAFLMLIGGALESLSERLLEIPILLLGAGWITLGAVLAQQAMSPQPSPADPPVPQHFA